MPQNAIASATLSDTEHAQLLNDVGHLDWWFHLITLERDGQTTRVISTNEEATRCFIGSLEKGLLHTWGYHKKFTLTKA